MANELYTWNPPGSPASSPDRIMAKHWWKATETPCDTAPLSVAAFGMSLMPSAPWITS